MEEKVILVVEDEKPLLNAIVERLSQSGFSVVSATSVDEAVQQLHKVGKVEAVWLDHYLFGQATGLDFLSFIKEGGSIYKDVPVFLVSNTASDENIKSYIALGVDKYYVKSGNKLSDIVEKIIQYINGEV